MASDNTVKAVWFLVVRGLRVFAGEPYEGDSVLVHTIYSTQNPKAVPGESRGKLGGMVLGH